MSEYWIGILIALFFSAFFSAAKSAFFTSNKLQFELDKHKQNLTSRILNLFYQHPNQYIFTIFTGKVFAMIMYVFLMLEEIVPCLNLYINNWVLIFILSLLIISCVYLFFSEFIPIILINYNSRFFLMQVAIPLYFIYILLYPISKFIFLFGRFILKLFGFNFPVSDTLIIGRDELDEFIQKTIDDSTQDTELDKEVRLLQNAMEFSSIKIRDCIVPRTEIVAVERSTSIQELIDLFVKTGLSKIIVYEDDLDNITGYIHSSELFTKPKDWTQSIYTLPFVPENMAANKLMQSMLDEKKSIAVVVDEFGGTSGIITLEDLVEEIFGEIEDEHDRQRLLSRQIGEGEYVFSGRQEIDHINEEFHLNIPKSDDYMTVAGYILHCFQDFPKLNETIIIDNYEITLLRGTHTKIELVKLKRIND